MRVIWSVVPYGGVWAFTHPTTGVRIVGRDRDQLMLALRNHNESNGIAPWDNEGKRVEELICAQMPGHCLDAGFNPGRTVSISRQDVVRGTRVMLAYVRQGSPKVEREEAIKRSSICWGCGNRATLVGGCSACASLAALVSGAEPTGFDLDNQACSICHCSLKAAVWLPVDVQCLALTDTMRVDFEKATRLYGCWKNCPIK